MLRSRLLALGGIAALVAVTWIAGVRPRRASAADATRVPVLVELFTSEGCSDCPPADQILSQLVREQPIAGVQVVGLGFHVDYWDEDGWKDRFSSRQYTRRQQNYNVMMGDQTYTPEVVVNGRRSVVGNDARGVRDSILKAARSPLPQDISVSGHDGKVQVAVHDLESGRPVYLALVENGLETRVGAGENNGHTLHHDAVVRGLFALGKTATPQWSAAWEVPPQDCASPGDRSVVAFVQKREGGEVLAVTSLPLSFACAPGK